MTTDGLNPIVPTVQLLGELEPDPMDQAAGAAVVAGDMPEDDRHVVWLGQAKLVRDQCVKAALDDFLARVAVGLGVGDPFADGPPAVRLQEMLAQHHREVAHELVEAERRAGVRGWEEGRQSMEGDR